MSELNQSGSESTAVNHDTGAASAAKMARFALRRPVTICMLMLSMLIFGLAASRLLPLERFPGIDFPGLFVNVPYPNATPEEVERMITRPIEEALSGISGIKRLRSTSDSQGANVQIEFDWSENIGAKGVEVREQLDAIRHLLPDDVERVMVFQFNTADIPVFQLRSSSNRDLSLAYELLERQLKRPLERVDGVARVNMYGVHKRQIEVQFDKNKMAAMHLNVATVVSNLRGQNFAISAGYFYQGEEKVLLSPHGELQSLAEVEKLAVQPGVMLKDIAQIRLTLPEAEEGRHLDRTYAIGMDISKESSANMVEVARQALQVLEQTKSNPQFEGINLFVMDNSADDITRSLSDLLQSGLTGALLSLITLYLFLRHIAMTAIVVLSVPLSICITLGFMYLFGYSLNVLTLMGLMLAVGMLVDNAVVVTESIFTEQQKPENQHLTTSQLAERGVAQVALAVLAGTFTTAVVFLPNIYGTKTDVTIFLEHVAVAICISLFASLVIAQTLIPLLVSKLKRLPAATNNSAAKPATALYPRYYKTLSWVMNNPRKSTVLAVLLLASIAVPLGQVSGGDNEDSQGRLFINYNFHTNYNLQQIESTVNQMEAFLYEHKEDFYFSSVYTYYRQGYAMSTLLLPKELPVSQAELKKRIKDKMPLFAEAAPTFGWDNGNGGGIQIHLQGQSTTKLLELSENVLPLLQQLPELTDVKLDMGGDQTELQIVIDRNKTAPLGLTTADIAQIIATAGRGQKLRTVRNQELGEVDLWVKFDRANAQSLQQLQTLPIATVNGRNITLANVADFVQKPQFESIRRYNRQTDLSIGANLAKDVPLDKAREAINKVVEQLNLPAGYKVSLGGSFERQDESQQVMVTNMLLAVAMIYIVMAALFESLLLPTAVIGSLLFSMVGVFWALLFTGTTMGVMVLIGMLVLMGIVVNNGIVLVDHINQLQQQGYAVRDAIVEGSVNRLRPIMMTVSTTILGLVPLALGSTALGGNGPSYGPMAIAIIGGLGFSTVTSLYFVPLAYYGLTVLADVSKAARVRSKMLASKVIKA